MFECPKCGGSSLYKDGMRYLSDGNAIQRYLCCQCGYRFSEHIRTVDDPYADAQICALEAKNLEPQQKPKVAGESLPQKAKGTIVQFGVWQLNQGYSTATIKGRVKLLQRLARLGADFDDENSVKGVIATQQQWSVSRKFNAVDAYDTLCKMLGKSWTPPIYKRVRKLPFIPTEAEIDQLIAGSSDRMSTYLQLLKETGMRCGEASQLKWTDIDTQSRTVRVTPEKGSNPRILRLSPKFIDMLQNLPKKAPTIFGVNSELMRRNFGKQRLRIASKLKNPRLMQITFHTFRHWKATMEYYKTRDILHVKEVLGHKSLDNTMLYTQLIKFQDDDFSARVAHSEEEALSLIENGYDFVCDFNGNKLFKKRK